MEYIKAETIRATASRLEAIEQRVSELGVAQANRNEELKSATGFTYKKGSNKATFGGVISSQTYNFAKQMLDDMSDHKKIHISINSPGGSAIAGVALYNAFNQADQEIVMTVAGQAYSAAGVMLQGADVRQAARGAIVGVHRSWCKAQGNAGDFSNLIVDLRKSDENVMEIFSSVVPDTKVAKVKEYMEKDTALTGKQALDVGLIDKVLTRKEAKALNKEDKNDEVKNESAPVEQDVGDSAVQDILNKVDKILAKVGIDPVTKPEPEPEQLTAKEVGETLAETTRELVELRKAFDEQKTRLRELSNSTDAKSEETPAPAAEVKAEAAVEASAESKMATPNQFKLIVPIN